MASTNARLDNADRYLRMALEQLRAEETERQEEFDREMADLRSQISAIESLLSKKKNNGVVSDRQEQFWVAPVLDRRPTPKTVIPGLAPDLTPREWARRLRDLSQSQALIRIAEENGGVLKTAEAKAILIKAGKIQGNPRNALGHVYHLVNKSDRFERIAPGTFRLCPPGGCVSEETQAESDPEQSAQEIPTNTLQLVVGHR